MGFFQFFTPTASNNNDHNNNNGDPNFKPIDDDEEAVNNNTSSNPSASLCYDNGMKRSTTMNTDEEEDVSTVESQQLQQGTECTLDVNYTVPSSMNENNGKGGKTTQRRRRRRICILTVITIVVLLGFILIVALVANNKNTKTMTPSSIMTSASLAQNSAQQSQNNNNVVIGSYKGNGAQDVPFAPFSVLDPVTELGRVGMARPAASSPNKLRLDPAYVEQTTALPTNAWYQNLLRLEKNDASSTAQNSSPGSNHRVYTVPYLLDASDPEYAGVRVHGTRLEATPTQVRVHIDEPYALTLGAGPSLTQAGTTAAASSVQLLDDKGYTVQETTELGITLSWLENYMTSTIVRGAPYVTMLYNMEHPQYAAGIVPTMKWDLDMSSLPKIDGASRSIDCTTEPNFTVQRDLEVSLFNSKQRWIVFFSQPVQLHCQNQPGTPTIFQVVPRSNNNPTTLQDKVLIIRGALVNLVQTKEAEGFDDTSTEEYYAQQLRKHANIYPGPHTSVTQAFDPTTQQVRIAFNWDPQSMGMLPLLEDSTQQIVMSRTGKAAASATNEEEAMIMFALPHHQDILASNTVMHNICASSLLGPVCITVGNTWYLYEDLPTVDLHASRPPAPQYVPLLADAVVDDIQYQIPENFQIGAGDTYFSGKTIARLARILVITEELYELCDTANTDNNDYKEACTGIALPSETAIRAAVTQLRDVVTVWVRTNTQAPFVYDQGWGGIINCGCLYDGGQCTNTLPDCPALTDQGLNFGNSFYNDHHFHYGYHVYAAAVLAHFDPDWAVEYYEDVTLLIRDYANPSADDPSFPTFRNKDWYRGHSYASGITEPMFQNIMNQESTSEAIAAYEAVALYGKVMTSVFEDLGETEKATVAQTIHQIGLSLTATEIRSTQKYWHVRRQNNDNAVEDAAASEKIYPATYQNSVVGILWETMVEFTTFFGNAPYLIYGIQLLPLTPISEARDNQLGWIQEMYEPLSQSCNAACINEGWSVQINAILATLGYVNEAMQNTLSIPSTAYDHAGGNGHSKSNTIWYIATRPLSTAPLDDGQFDGSMFTVAERNDFNNNNNNKIDTILDNAADDYDYDYDGSDNVYDNVYNSNHDTNHNTNKIFDDGAIIDDTQFNITCSNRNTCTNPILNTLAGGYTCGARIQWLMERGTPEITACHIVAIDEHPEECGPCQP